MKNERQPVTNRYIKIAILRRASSRMIPVYRRIARDRAYAESWTASLRKADLSHIGRLLKKTGISVFNKDICSTGCAYTNYSVDFYAPHPIDVLSNGMSMSRNAPKSSFQTHHHQLIASVILPFYKEIASNQEFARGVVEANRSGDTELLTQLVRSKIKSNALRNVHISKTGFQLVFRFGLSPIAYYNKFYRGVDY